METTKAFGVVLGLAAVLSTVGCGGSAVVVRRGRWSGELALQGPVTEAFADAEVEMAEHCGGRARIVRDDEAGRIEALDAAPRAASSPGAERVRYVCVTRAQRLGIGVMLAREPNPRF